MIFGWILDFLMDRTQRVTGVYLWRYHQGLASSLHSLYTDDFSQHDNRYILKFADDFAIFSLLYPDENDHGPINDDSEHWCDRAEHSSN